MVYNFDVTSYQCDVCPKVFSTFAALGGHRGAHTRRKEAPAIAPIRLNGRCPDCDEQFETSAKLAGHRRKVHRDWNLMRTDKCRKSRLLLERGHRCEECSLSEWRGQPIPLQLEHKDGNPMNSSKENFALICPNCHAQTDTYCGRNIGRPKCAHREKAKSYRTAT